MNDITEAQADELFMELGLDHFMTAADQCSSSDRIYNGTVNGWTRGQCLYIYTVKYIGILNLVFLL